MILLFCLPSKWLLIVTVYLLWTGYWLCTLFFFILSIVLVDNLIGSWILSPSMSWGWFLLYQVKDFAMHWWSCLSLPLSRLMPGLVWPKKLLMLLHKQRMVNCLVDWNWHLHKTLQLHQFLILFEIDCPSKVFLSPVNSIYFFLLNIFCLHINIVSYCPCCVHRSCWMSVKADSDIVIVCDYFVS